MAIIRIQGWVAGWLAGWVSGWASAWSLGSHGCVTSMNPSRNPNSCWELNSALSSVPCAVTHAGGIKQMRGVCVVQRALRRGEKEGTESSICVHCVFTPFNRIYSLIYGGFRPAFIPAYIHG